MKENILRENDIRGRYPNEINEETIINFISSRVSISFLSKYFSA